MKKDDSWKIDTIELRQHKDEGYCGCFGCGETLCIDPIQEMVAYKNAQRLVE